MTLKVVPLLIALLMPAWSQAQSLADLAKEEEARRRAIKVPARVYTNRDLKPAPDERRPTASTSAVVATSEPTAPQVGIPIKSPTDPGAKAPALSASVAAGSDTPSKGEAYWRARITAARNALERSRVLGDALQSRLNALATDIVNRDDPAQRAQLERDRQRAIFELDRIKNDIAEQTKAIADVEEEARKAGVPPGWLR